MTDLCTNLGTGSTFARCVINTLLNLAAAALEALKLFLLSQIPFLDMIVAGLLMQLLQYDILGIWMKAQKEAIQAAMDEALSTLNGLPLGIIDPACLEWAGIMGSINDLIQGEIRPPIDQILNELERLLSFQEDVNALKTKYEEMKQSFLDLIDLIEAVLLEQKCRAAEGGNVVV